MNKIKMNYLLGKLLGLNGDPLEILERVERLRFS